MINLSTPNDILHRELMADRQKSHYWLVKKLGGDKSYEKMRDRLLAEARKEKCNKISDVIEYRSTNGNRWMTYECARYYPEAKASYTTPYAFCFYETYGSVGAFIPVKLNSMKNGIEAVLIFNSHFFHQMSERLGLKFRSPEMVRAFHEFIPSMLMKTYQDEDDGRVKLVVRLPGSIGWGFLRDGDVPVFEIRTFLSDKQLNGKQKRITENLRANADKFTYEPEEIVYKRLSDKIGRGEDIKDDLMKFKGQWTALGIPEKMFYTAFAVNMAIVTAFNTLEYKEFEDSLFLRRHFEMNGQIIADYVCTIDSDDERFIRLLEQCAKNMGIRKFDSQEAAQKLEKLKV